ncbi:MAG TPA: ABC transporter permease [Thermoflexales bacterium]|nr:ABC transporter permease [Thermoflexales bacterium]HQW34961.1 ABC transporter permease [Thermoflexales bacterium]HQX75245.1 ABC transporter permease [Thermoflexales bacterium]HQZ20808.1 ABC transporter permease [Thermoflexales bacterium]HQZ99931.1 ABC transporter permease [Thermoflexales bacterium]
MQNIKSELREIWNYRHLLQMMVTRDLKTRYQRSVLGVAWSFLQPLGMMIVMTFAFTVLNPSNIPRAHVFILSGLLAWNFFSAAITTGTGSVVANGALVKKVYFPRILLPISAVLSQTVNFLLALPMFVLVAVISGHPLQWTLALVPIVILMQVMLCIGLALLLSTLHVFYRDTQFIIDLSMLALFFLTPIWYDISTVGPRLVDLFGLKFDVGLWVRRLNPMASLVNVYQELMYHGRVTALDFWVRTALTSVLVLLVGFFVFRHFSARFGEEV